MIEFPKIIHLVYLGFDGPMPKQWKQNKKKWENMNADFEVILWDMKSVKDLISNIDPSFLPTFNEYKYNIQRADACRPFILFEYGGIYTDLDTSPNHDISNLLSMYEVNPHVEVLLAKSTQDKKKPNNYFMVSKPQSNFWLNIIYKMKERKAENLISKHMTVMHTTGLLLYNDTLSQYKNKEEIELIPQEILTDCDICNKSNKKKDNEKFHYLNDGQAKSWNGFDTKLLNGFYCTFKPLMELPGWVSLLLIIGALILNAVLIILLIKKNNIKK